MCQRPSACLQVPLGDLTGGGGEPSREVVRDPRLSLILDTQSSVLKYVGGSTVVPLMYPDGLHRRSEIGGRV